MPDSSPRVVVRPGTLSDSEAIARIYNDGIDDRIATFETRHRTAEDISAWFGGRYPVVVVAHDDEVVSFAATSSYRARECYAGIAEYSVYVARSARGQGAGRAALTGLIHAARQAGFWKLVSRIFPENTASLRLAENVGFRQVGVYERHAQLDGEWKDVVIVECLIDRHGDA
jgi:phosphinothricin acetyltransferase